MTIYLEDEDGFKVPNTSIVKRDFILIPTEYVTKQDSQDNYGVLQEYYEEDGTKRVKFIPINIYQEVDGEYYMDSAELNIGDYILKPDSIDTYQISKLTALTGVYNINKGYADFKQVSVLYNNDEYSIVESNSKYGLNVYDYIVLDASKIENEDFIHR